MRPTGEKNIYEMRKCLYGHALSGKYFVDGLMKHLGSKKFKDVSGLELIACQTEPAVMRSSCGKLYAAVYVDDIIISGPQELKDKFWEGIRARYKVGRANIAGRFLGMMLQFSLSSTARWLRIGMDEYTQAIIAAYSAAVPERKLTKKNVPSTKDLRERRDARTSKKAPDYVPEIVGMILWLARVTRSEILHAAGALGAVMHVWAVDADDQLHVCICYLWTYPDGATVYTATGSEEEADYAVGTYTDSNWMLPKSTSGWVCILESHQEGGWTYCPLVAGSKGQAVTTCNSAEAELIAEFAGLRDTLCIREIANKESAPIIVRGDNKAASTQAQRGFAGRQSEFSIRTIGINSAWLRGMFDGGIALQRRVPTEKNPSNIFTKSVTNGNQFRFERQLNGVLTVEEFRAPCPAGFDESAEAGERRATRSGGTAGPWSQTLLKDPSKKGVEHEEAKVDRKPIAKTESARRCLGSIIEETRNKLNVVRCSNPEQGQSGCGRATGTEEEC
jgi:hypothetical protein